MSEQLKIVRALPFFGTEHGGPIAQARLVDAALVARGHQVTRITSDLAQPADIPRDRLTEIDGIRCFFATARGLSRAAPYAPPRAARNALRKALANADIATCNVGLSLWAPCVGSAAAHAGVPWVYNVEGALDAHRLTIKGLRKRAFLTFFERRALRAAAALQAVTTVEAAALQRQGARNDQVHVIPNGVELPPLPASAQRAAGRRALRVSDSAYIVLFFGRVNTMKGVDLLLEGCAAAMRERIEIHLAIIGPDEGARPALEDRARALGVDTRVRIEGRVDSAERRAELYAAADVFALPSWSEGLPNAVLEAAAAGLPLLVSAGCNIPEVESYEAGRICALQADDVAVAIADLHDHPELRRSCAENARKMVAERFSAASVVDRLEALYRDLATRSGLHSSVGRAADS